MLAHGNHAAWVRRDRLSLARFRMTGQKNEIAIAGPSLPRDRNLNCSTNSEINTGLS
jgi:hypothetical protein